MAHIVGLLNFFQEKQVKLEIILNYFWSLAAWGPGPYLFTYIYSKKKDWKEGTLEVVNSALVGLLGLDTFT